jgi:hypothetical protein
MTSIVLVFVTSRVVIARYALSPVEISAVFKKTERHRGKAAGVQDFMGTSQEGTTNLIF